MNIKSLARGALTGALYVLLTLLFAPISSGLIQVRIAEALCILPYFTFAAVPGLFIGCLLANLITGAVLYDVIFGSLATLIAALLTHVVKKRGLSPWLAPLPAVIVNALIIGALLHYVYEVGVPLFACMLYVGAGQAVACYALGMPLLFVLDKKKGLFFS